MHGSRGVLAEVGEVRVGGQLLGGKPLMMVYIFLVVVVVVVL